MQLTEKDSMFVNTSLVKVSSTLCTVLIDAEENFDWLRPVRGVAYDVDCMRHLNEVQTILSAYGAVPTYLLTYPVLQDAAIVAAIRGRVERGHCRVGLQMHSWVTPPYEEAAIAANSFGFNLSPDLEERKLVALMTLFRTCFGHTPTIFRAGRYGLGPHTIRLLEKHGFEVDTSIAPRTTFQSEHGPDFSNFACTPFWFGCQRRLLELPLCRDIVGWGGLTGTKLYQALHSPPSGTWVGPKPKVTHDPIWSNAPGWKLGGHIRNFISRLTAISRFAERVTLSPEGNDTAAVDRLVASLLRHGPTVLALSLHSSSLHVGSNPYVQNRMELHWLYDRISAMMDMMVNRHSVRFVAGPDLPTLLAEATFPTSHAL